MSQRRLKPMPMRWNSLLEEYVFSSRFPFQPLRRTLYCAFAIVGTVLLGSGLRFSDAQTTNAGIPVQSANSQASTPNSQPSSTQRLQEIKVFGIAGSKPAPMMWLPAEKVKLHLKSDPLPFRSLLSSTVKQYKVAIVFIVGLDGNVREVRYKKDLSDAPHEVVEAAIRSVSARTYRPFVSDGKPTEVFADLTFSRK